MTRSILISKYNDLSKIIDVTKKNKIIKIIPSPHHYYDLKKNRMMKDSKSDHYSILDIYSTNDNKPIIVKQKQSGFIALKIPYIESIPLFKDVNY